MAEEAKDLGAISNSGTQPSAVGAPTQAQTTEPEVHILEERVTHTAQKPVSSAPISPAPVPPDTSTNVPANPSAMPSAASTPAVAQAAPEIIPKVPKPTPPPAPPSAPIEEKPLPENLEKPALGNDIAKILAAVKLPDRRDDAIPNKTKVVVEPKKFDTSIAGSALNDGTPSPAPTTPQPEPNHVSPGAIPGTVVPPSNAVEAKRTERNPSSVTAVHTLKDDLQGVVHDQKISVVKAVSLEEDRRAHRSANADQTPGAQQRSGRLFGILFASFTLLVLGAGALFGVFFVMNQQKTPPQIDTGSSILFAEQSVLLSLNEQSPTELKRALESGRGSSQGALGSITRIIPVISEVNADGVAQNRPATFKELMGSIGAHTPDEALRALGNDFFLGVHAADKSAPLIIVPVISHARAFAAMLTWEDTLNPDLSPFFTSVPLLKQDANGIPSKRTYEDLIMRNYDVRALKDDRGEIQLYYSFPTQNILIIAESPYSFPEILSRLQASRQL